LDFIDALKASAFPPLLTRAHTLSAWREPLAAMWRFTKNNGITEGFHRKMKLIQRRAYGLKTSLTTAFALSLNAANFPTKTTPSQKFGGDLVKG
jgi:hypothetical protein